MVFAAFLLGVTAFYAFSYFPFLSATSALCALTVLGKKKKYLLAAVAIAGMLYPLARQVPAVGYPMAAEITGVFSSSAIQTENGFSQRMKVNTIRMMPGGKALRTGISSITLYSETAFPHGGKYRLPVTIKKPAERPGSSGRPYAVLEDAAVLEDTFEVLGFSWLQGKRAEVNRYLMARFSPDRAALLMAITTGERGRMGSGLREAFSTTGLAHLLSISGTHFGIFSVLLFAAARFLITRLPHTMLENVTARISVTQGACLLSFPFMLMYLGLSGGSIPSLRSFIMISLFMLGLVLGKKGHWLNFLLFAAALLTLWEPTVLFTLSFQMSFSAVLFIGFFVRQHEPEWTFRRYPINLLWITIAATLATAPLVAYHFHLMSLISPLSNLVVTPIVGFLLIPLSIFSSFTYIAIGIYPAAPVVDLLCGVSIWLVKTLSSVPFSSVRLSSFPAWPVVTYFALCLTYMAFEKKRLIALAAVPVVAVALYTAGVQQPLTIAFLNVGKGDSSVISTPGGKTIVVDTGFRGKQTVAYLRRLGTKDVDALVLTHAHKDHAGGIGHIMENFRVKEVWDNGDINYPVGLPEGTTKRTISRGDVVQGEGYSITVLHPYPGFVIFTGSDNQEINNRSVVLRVQGAKGGSFLLTGDILAEAEEDLLGLGPGLRSQVLKLPHHHHRLSHYRNSKFLKAVSPDIAVISSNRPGKGQYPDVARVLHTRFDGAVKIKDTADGLVVSRYIDTTLKMTRTIKGELSNIGKMFRVW